MSDFKIYATPDPNIRNCKPSAHVKDNGVYLRIMAKDLFRSSADLIFEEPQRSEFIRKISELKTADDVGADQPYESVVLREIYVPVPDLEDDDA